MSSLPVKPIGQHCFYNFLFSGRGVGSRSFIGFSGSTLFPRWAVQVSWYLVFSGLLRCCSCKTLGFYTLPPFGSSYSPASLTPKLIALSLRFYASIHLSTIEYYIPTYISICTVHKYFHVYMYIMYIPAYILLCYYSSWEVILCHILKLRKEPL